MDLNHLRVLQPCEESWDAMQGDARQRLCLRCNLTTHDLSALTRVEIRALLDQPGRLCARVEHDERGALVTADSPRPRLAPRRWLVLLTALAGWLGGCAEQASTPTATPLPLERPLPGVAPTSLTPADRDPVPPKLDRPQLGGTRLLSLETLTNTDYRRNHTMGVIRGIREK